MPIIVLLVVAASLALGACGGSSDDGASAAQKAPSASAPSLPPPIASPAEDPEQDTINEALAGLTQEQAEAAATAAGYTTRVVSVDGEPRMMTMDYRTDRINLEIDDDQVTRAYVG